MPIDFPSANAPADVLLIGAGIMSATLGVLLKELEPGLKIEIFERLDEVAAESSDAWNNAGTGHSAFCELNYTPEKPDGSIDISKANRVAEAFELSRQFWAFLVQQDLIKDPKSFINSVPHMSFVTGADNVEFLRKRHAALIQSPLFAGMKYSEDWQQLAEWFPLIIKAREKTEPVAATRMEAGTDVNFGCLTRQLMDILKPLEKVRVHLRHEVRDLEQLADKSWEVKVKNLLTGEKRKIRSRFVFIGAGGGALPLLTKSDIPESEGFGGFPVSGQWLRCTNPEVIAQHAAKVYGLAKVGSPPMSVPHLDSRIINGEKALLFGPFAGFTTRFLKKGSWFDLPLSINFSNLKPMLEAGYDNIPLTRYLVSQVMQSPEDRMEELRHFIPTAKAEDWELKIAGQRVQIIKKDPEDGGILEFGTEVVSAADGTLAALLGASPGASTAVSIMVTLLQKCFPEKYNSPEWQQRLTQMLPTLGQNLREKPELCADMRAYTAEVLQLNNSPVTFTPTKNA